MPRKRLPDDERKEIFSIRLQKWIIDRLRQETNYNSIIEKLLLNYFKKKD